MVVEFAWLSPGFQGAVDQLSETGEPHPLPRSLTWKFSTMTHIRLCLKDLYPHLVPSLPLLFLLVFNLFPILSMFL